MSFVPRIRTILVLAFLTAAGLPLAVFWAWPQTSLQTFQMDEVRNRQAVLARNLAASMAAYHQDLVNALQSFAPLIADGRGEEVRTSLENLHFNRICVVQPDTGAVVRSFLGARKGCPDWYSDARLKVFTELAGNAGVGVSPVAYAVNGPPEIQLATRAYDVLIVGAISTQFFRDLRTAVDADGDGYTAIVDQTGHVLAHPDSALQNVATDLTYMEPVRQILAGQSGSNSFSSAGLQSDMIAGFATVDGPGWGVFLPQSVAHLHRAAERVERESLAVLALALLLSGIAGLFLSRKISAQLSQMAETTRVMANGDRSQRIAESGPEAPSIRELTDLGTSLNSMADDIAAAHECELELRKSAEQSANAKAEFLANISGEIRTPLTSMLDMTEKLQADTDESNQTRRLEMVAETGRSMLGILDDILEFSQLGTRQVELRQEPIDLTKISLSAIRLLMPAAQSKGIDLITRVPTGVPTLIQGDAGRLRQLLINLVGNAVKFTQSGHVSVDVQVIPADGASASIEITVADTGIGVSPERLDKIFSAFEHDSSEVAEIQTATGLGLAICQRITKAMGGALTVESEIGSGSTFQFIAQMPLATVHREDTDTYAGAFSNLRAMIVAANPLQRGILAEYLESFGLTECHEFDPDPSIRVFQGDECLDETINLVIYDPHGFDFTTTDIQRLMLQRPGRTPAKLIVLANPASAIDGISSFAVVLDKPLAPSELCSALLAPEPAASMAGTDPRQRGRSGALQFLKSKTDSAADHKGLVRASLSNDGPRRSVQLFTHSNIHRSPVQNPRSAPSFIAADDLPTHATQKSASPQLVNTTEKSDPSFEGVAVDRHLQNVMLIGDDPESQSAIAVVLDQFEIVTRVIKTTTDAVETLKTQTNVSAALIDLATSSPDILKTASKIRDVAFSTGHDRLMIIGLVEPGIVAQERDLRAAGFTHLLKKPMKSSVLRRLFGAEPRQNNPVAAEIA